VTTIRLSFPGSRYHATPWGRHVNEGVAEWPPSPYRLLRGLYDVWKRKCSDIADEEVESVLGALAATAPSFVLPSVVASHTRSYLPSNSLDPTDKNLIFDAFLAFNPKAACYVHWPEVRMDEQQVAILVRLLGGLNYLGRSESWIEARLDRLPEEGQLVCAPALEQYDGEITRVACVVPPAEFKSKRSWLDALTATTTEMLKERRSDPPLLRMVPYIRPEIETDPVSRRTPRSSPVQAVLLGLDATVLPLATTTIELADQIRVRLMGAHRKRMADDPTRVSPLFSGKDASGKKRLDHGHLYILPLSNKVGRIDRVLLLSKQQPFRPEEFDAVRGVRELYQREGRPGVRCVAVWQGKIEDKFQEFRLSTDVESATPFVTIRHMRRGRDPMRFLQDEVRRECRNQGILEPISVELLPRIRGLFHTIEYRRNRKDDPAFPGYAFRLKFEKPVLAPLSLGYGSHFGLGQFQPYEQVKSTPLTP